MYVGKYSIIPLVTFHLLMALAVSSGLAILYYCKVSLWILAIIAIIDALLQTYKVFDDYLDCIIINEEGLKYTFYNGLFSKDEKSIDYSDIVTINSKQGLFGLIFGFGELEIVTQGGYVKFYNLNNVKYIKDLIDKKTL